MGGSQGINGVAWDWIDEHRDEADLYAVAAPDAWRQKIPVGLS